MKNGFTKKIELIGGANSAAGISFPNSSHAAAHFPFSYTVVNFKLFEFRIVPSPDRRHTNL
jgi:hypothetical protein